MKSLKASVLAIGTEVTSGEILNSNSKWISESLENIGIEVHLHLAVPDERELMLKALDFSADSSDILFLTGGLGPTSDDFTREVVAEWSGQPLEFHQEAWEQIQAVLTQRKVPVRDSHRRECEFPRSAKLLKNIVGTAQGFMLSTQGKTLFVLPGPPREIQAMWEPSLAPHLKDFKPTSRLHLFKWSCFGVAESEVADQVENLAKGSSVKLGYRASPPYVHVKLWSQDPDRDQDVIQKLGESLSEWIPYRGDDLLTDFFDCIESFSGIQIFDNATQGLLASRLFENTAGESYNREKLNVVYQSSQNDSESSRGSASDLFLKATAVSPSRFKLSLQGPGLKSQESFFEVPFRFQLPSTRARKHVAEMALIQWLLWLQERG